MSFSYSTTVRFLPISLSPPNGIILIFPFPVIFTGAFLVFLCFVDIISSKTPFGMFDDTFFGFLLFFGFLGVFPFLDFSLPDAADFAGFSSCRVALPFLLPEFFSSDFFDFPFFDSATLFLSEAPTFFFAVLPALFFSFPAFLPLRFFVSAATFCTLVSPKSSVFISFTPFICLCDFVFAIGILFLSLTVINSIKCTQNQAPTISSTAPCLPRNSFVF